MKNSQLQETSQEKIITSLLNIPGAKTGLLNCRSSRRVLSKIIVLNSFHGGTNQWTGFYMITASVMKELTLFYKNSQENARVEV